MSGQLTYESVLKLIQEGTVAFEREMQESAAAFDQRIQETDRLIQRNIRAIGKMRREMRERAAEYDRISKETNKKISALGSRIGEIVEYMIGGKILDKFQALGYSVDDYTRKHQFRMKKLGIRGEIDLILHDGDTDILIEVKTALEVADVREFLETIEKFRIYADARWKDSPRFIGAVAGAVVDEQAIKFAHDNGLYTIVQSGEAVNIVPTPEGFEAREW